MKKCIRKAINYLSNEPTVSALIKKTTGSMVTSTLMSANENGFEFEREKTIPYFLYNFLAQDAKIIVLSTNMFEKFSEYFTKTLCDEETITDLMINLAEIYSGITMNNYIVCDFFETYYNTEFKMKIIGSFFSYLTMHYDKFYDALMSEVVDLDELCILDIKPLIENSKEIVKTLSKGYENLTLDDINNISASFSSLGLSTDLSGYIYKTLKSRQENKTIKVEKSIKPKIVKVQSKTSNGITDKEYKSILKEIRKYYNPFKKELIISDISSEMTEYIAYLMVKIGIEDAVVIDFLKKTNKEKCFTYEYFKNHMEEFKYYFNEEISVALEYMKEIETCDNESDKEYWIFGINEELSKLDNQESLNTYEYEIKKLKIRRCKEIENKG